MDEEEESPEAKFRLTDIEVDTVGLVRAGANLAGPFILLKSQQEATPMDDELEIEEVEETPSLATTDPPPETSPPPTPVDDSFFEKMRGQFEKWGIIKARASKDTIAAAAKMLGVSPKKMAAAYAGMMDGEEEPEEEMEMGKKPGSGSRGSGKNSTRKAAPPQEETQMTQTDLQKAIEAAQEAKLDALLEKAKTEVEKAYQAKVTALETQVSDLSKEATDQRDKREEREFLEKAMTFRCFPVSYTELGGMLRQINKSLDKEAYEKWEAVLKAADAQLFTAGLFNEMGTARTADEVVLEERVEKIAKEKNVSYKEALEALTPAEQAQMLRESQARAGGRHAS